MSGHAEFTDEDVLKLLQKIQFTHGATHPDMHVFKHGYVGDSFDYYERAAINPATTANCMPLSEVRSEHIQKFGIGKTAAERLRNIFIADSIAGKTTLLDFSNRSLDSIVSELDGLPTDKASIGNFVDQTNKTQTALLKRLAEIRGGTSAEAAPVFHQLRKSYEHLRQVRASIPEMAQHAQKIDAMEKAIRDGMHGHLVLACGQETADFAAALFSDAPRTASMAETVQKRCMTPAAALVRTSS